jgi:flagellar assembly protein FliH
LGAEQKYHEAYEQGFKEGYQSGEQEAVESAIRIIEQSTTLTNSLAEEAAKLAMAIASAVIGEQVSVAPETVKGIAAKALQESVIGETVTISINPKDKPTLDSGSELLSRIANGAKLLIETDEDITQGGCIVRSDFGEVDASIEVLLEAIAQRLGLQNER